MANKKVKQIPLGKYQPPGKFSVEEKKFDTPQDELNFVVEKYNSYAGSKNTTQVRKELLALMNRMGVLMLNNSNIKMPQRNIYDGE